MTDAARVEGTLAITRTLPMVARVHDQKRHRGLLPRVTHHSGTFLEDVRLFPTLADHEKPV
jgi:hypothetical protein